MSTGRLLQGLALLTAVLYSGLAWLWYVELIPGADGLHPFDSRFFGYTAEEGRTYLNALSDEARQIYLTDIRLLDTVFPISLTALLAGLMIRWTKGGWRGLAILPLGYLAADLVENARVARLLAQDDVTSQMILAASTATVAKYGALMVSVIALGAAFVTTRTP
ncbi:hypothetical protein [Jannaschia sp. CCS1]|uniref:hypothetical protein n=1 Tax=Jannaschia sp. (strain CCS1) TaxID=290400 RepID=UPI000053C3C4|nr:hypothetical protein [Jannaschia sp. CCS1]ABD53631.1 hypothetical protein Jann_0714 [Jannaschia sp. CCS1]